MASTNERREPGLGAPIARTRTRRSTRRLSRPIGAYRGEHFRAPVGVTGIADERQLPRGRYETPLCEDPFRAANRPLRHRPTPAEDGTTPAHTARRVWTRDHPKERRLASAREVRRTCLAPSRCDHNREEAPRRDRSHHRREPANTGP